MDGPNVFGKRPRRRKSAAALSAVSNRKPAMIGQTRLRIMLSCFVSCFQSRSVEPRGAHLVYAQSAHGIRQQTKDYRLGAANWYGTPLRQFQTCARLHMARSRAGLFSLPKSQYA